MARARLKWADASELSNRTRPDLPPTFILRVSDAACSDLKIDPPGEDDNIAAQHPLVRKFVDVFVDSEAIDDGVPFAQMPGRGLYRIRTGDWRGIVWADTPIGVVWLCRAVRLADYSSERAAYDALAALGDDGIFPMDGERRVAQRDQKIVYALRAMRDAMQAAHELPNSWHQARMRAAGQPREEGVVIGRAYVEEIEVDEEVVIDRFMIALVCAPDSEIPHEEWLKLVMARVFPRHGGKVDFVGPDALPAGHDLRPGPEVALAQEA
ncbi:MAG: hypothetical protein ACTHKT_10800 [Solirubrobacterales bacterium]